MILSHAFWLDDGTTVTIIPGRETDEGNSLRPMFGMVLLILAVSFWVAL